MKTAFLFCRSLLAGDAAFGPLAHTTNRLQTGSYIPIKVIPPVWNQMHPFPRA